MSVITDKNPLMDRMTEPLFCQSVSHKMKGVTLALRLSVGELSLGFSYFVMLRLQTGNVLTELSQLSLLRSLTASHYKTQIFRTKSLRLPFQMSILAIKSLSNDKCHNDK